MSLNAFVRVSVFALLGCVWACAGDSTAPRGGGDSTGLGDQQVSVQLTATADHVTQPGNVDFVATISGGASTSGRKVRFYEKIVGSDAAPQEVGVDSVAPFTYTLPISSDVENGTKEF